MLDPKHIQNRQIKDLISDNYVFAAVLHYFGINFYQFEESLLKDVCAQFKLNPKQLTEELESWAVVKEPTKEELFLHPIEVLIAYLKRKHYFFVRQELPFLANMVSGIESKDEYALILADLKIMFPLFVEDFIHHIHEEESSVFQRIKLLQEIEVGDFGVRDSLKILESKPISSLAHAHEDHDDEMEGIRKLTNDYNLPQDAPLSMKILYNELQNFERELIIHATIEDDLLFPKAIQLEREVLRKIKKKINSN
ncbi:hemerythrin domain-containing protein [Belliella kenyensis]|uniref:Hemerythrin domain-containing protein n=1 Tax=Belliella kenyensis TaxID=1472724 RepID=A0ABV8EHR4_9BACT|nr:hemerythrin domain-containing protein [Belliella kenyensis]MCH7403154.1 hemerythrin domain-containing protein [Belliella kenyensis]MDN3602323.1 hemerythrin domain-containing protein [Belliella kenyensis]